MAVQVHKSKVKASTVILVILLILLAFGGSAAGIIAADCTGIDLNKDSVEINIPEGSGGIKVAEILKAEGVIKYPLVFKALSLSDKYSSIKPGKVEIKNGMSYKTILDLLCTEHDINRLTIPEGYELRQIAQKLENEGFCTAQAFYTALNDSYDYDFISTIPDRDNHLEGYLYPDTYLITEGASAHDIIDMMLSGFNDIFTDEFRSRANEMNMSIDDIVTMASVIERETDGETERAKVAGIFYNRLNKGMKLQSCATVQYILGERKPVLSVADTQIESPYNTYLHEGLPIGPISNPGIDCIKAALYPEDTDYLYFVLSKNGDHIFSKTYEEHLAAINSSESAVKVE